MIVTTAGRTNDQMIEKAKQIALELHTLYIPRRKRSITAIQQHTTQPILVVGKERLEVHFPHGHEPLFFHPNSASFRAKRILKGESEPFLQATKLQKGMTFLDCTLGLAADSIIASLVVGEEGKVVGVEGSAYIAYLTKQGLRHWDSDVVELNEAMRRIHVHHADFRSFLAQCDDQSYDVVYFDPMFEVTIEEADGVKGLKQAALYTDLTVEVIEQAKRVARQRIVLKDHWQSSRFQQFGFSVYRRKTAKFHFGTIELS
ncbi:class I SAM-dependent methyltransferase [Anoxybacillus suryakundensis]|uniref:Putative SAM-dependent methyltransferase n=1 Tax=Anoxybacillus suryakundensis TaxID=1325335 RepID=A0A0K6GPH9_9BACL|nr:class I SAM-dependent methyltransferase [Anoxybacillus suryakundensis]CUA80609.1 Putative SAM-dependent methyltransferase [Anoxybacillus suryakundensis]